MPNISSDVDENTVRADLVSEEDARGGRLVAKDARAVANDFIKKASAQGEQLTPMQLIKLVYIAHGWHLAWHEQPLFGDDVEAWRHGPVIASVYHAFKKYGREPITRQTYGDRDLVIDIGLLDIKDKDIRPKPISARFSPEERQTIDEIYRAYRGISGLKLSQITHQPGSPWEQAYRSGENVIIKKDLIMKHYKELDQENNKFLEQVS